MRNCMQEPGLPIITLTADAMRGDRELHRSRHGRVRLNTHKSYPTPDCHLKRGPTPRATDAFCVPPDGLPPPGNLSTGGDIGSG